MVGNKAIMICWILGLIYIAINYEMKCDEKGNQGKSFHWIK